MHNLETWDIYHHHQDWIITRRKMYATRVIDEFFSVFPGNTPRDFLWFMLSSALKVENEEADARQRADMIFLYDCLLMLFDAAEALTEKPTK